MLQPTPFSIFASGDAVLLDAVSIECGRSERLANKAKLSNCTDFTHAASMYYNLVWVQESYIICPSLFMQYFHVGFLR